MKLLIVDTEIPILVKPLAHVSISILDFLARISLNFFSTHHNNIPEMNIMQIVSGKRTEKDGHSEQIPNFSINNWKSMHTC